MSGVDFVLFGDPQIRIDGTPIEMRSRKAHAILIYLALHDWSMPREQLSLLLWPDASTQVAKTSLRNALHEIRQTPLSSVIEIERHDVTLDHNIIVDVLVFRDYLKQIMLSGCDSAYLSQNCVLLMQQALELYTDDFMTNFNILNSPEFEDWQLLIRVDLQFEATELLAKLARYYVEQGIVRSALRVLHRWLDMDPVNEEANQLIMHVYGISGQPERAVQQYHLLTRQIQREYGRMPDNSVQVIYNHIKSGEYQRIQPDLSATKAIRSILPVLPQAMIGRQNDLNHLKAQIIQNNRDHSILTLSGPPGIGKTALASTLLHDTDIQRHFYDGILWGSLSEGIGTTDVLRLWMDALRISVLRSSQRSEHLALQLNTGLYGKKILLVVDNVTSLEQARLFNFGETATVLLITPHTYSVALPTAIQVQKAIILAPISQDDAREILNLHVLDFSKHHKRQTDALLERYGMVPAALQAICNAYQQHVQVWGDNDTKSYLESLLNDTAILDLPTRDGKTIRQRLENYWGSIPSDLQTRLLKLMASLDVTAQYSQPDLSQMWPNDPNALRTLLDCGLLVRKNQAIQIHRLLWAYLS